MTFETETEKYEITFDDARISRATLEEALWLSPYIPADLPGPFAMAAGFKGKQLVDKVFYVPPLEYCATLPVPCTGDGLVPNPAFMSNAELNLRHGAAQLELLKKEKLPAALEPARLYLLRSLQRSLDLQTIRHEFLKTSDIKPMRELLCRECACQEAERKLLESMTAAADGKARLAFSVEWHQKVFECERQHSRWAYPLSAWERFISDFGITESHGFKRTN